MPSPSSSLATLRPDLAGSLMAFDLDMDRQNYIGHRVLRVFDTAVQAGKYGKIPLQELLKKRETRRAPGSGYARSNWTFEPLSFACEEHGAEEPVDDRQSSMYREYFNAELMATMRARGDVLRNAEQRIADALFNATTFSATSITNEWDDFANATPVDDVEASVRRVWAACGLWPNALIINKHVFRNLRQCAQIRDRIASSGAGNPTKAQDVTIAMLQAVFDLDHILVGGGATNTANEGQDAVIDKIWSDEYAMTARIAETDDIQEPCVGRTLHYTDDGSELEGTVEQYRDESVRSEIVRCRHDVDEVIHYVEAADLMDNITT